MRKKTERRMRKDAGVGCRKGWVVDSLGKGRRRMWKEACK